MRSRRLSNSKTIDLRRKSRLPCCFTPLRRLSRRTSKSKPLSRFQQLMSAEDALAPTRRHQHTLPDGRVAYEWSQSLSDVTVFVPCPPGVRGRDLDVRIERERCRLGLKGNPPYLDVSGFFVLLVAR